MKNSDRYLKIVEWSEEDGCYVGSCPGLFTGGCHGDNEEEVYHRLISIVDEWLELLAQDNKEFPPATAGQGRRDAFVSSLLGKPLLKHGRPAHA